MMASLCRSHLGNALSDLCTKMLQNSGFQSTTSYLLDLIVVTCQVISGDIAGRALSALPQFTNEGAWVDAASTASLLASRGRHNCAITSITSNRSSLQSDDIL